MKQNKKNKIYSIQFMRAVCAIGIVVFHFGCHSNCVFVKNTFGYGGLLGGIIVPIFFMISGFVMFYNYDEVKSVKFFYYKRWKSIFPMFFLVFIFTYMYNAVLAGKIFYGPEPWKLVFSLIGFDGYLMLYGVPTYYILGEWFLGALIFVYIVYPLLAYFISKNRFSWLIILAVLILGRFAFIWIDESGFNPWFIDKWYNSHLISCLLEFYIGILFCKYLQFFKNKLVVMLSFVFTIGAFWIYPIVQFVSTWCILTSALMFIWMFWLGTWIMKNKYLIKVFNELGKLSLPVFYLQHLVILFIFSNINPYSTIKSTALMCFDILAIIGLAKVLQIVTNYVTSSNWYLFAERKLGFTNN